MTDPTAAQGAIEKVGQIVRLLIEIDGETHVYNCRVDGVLADSIAVSWPTDHLVHIPVYIGQKVRLETRSDRGVFRLASIVGDKVTDEPPTLHIVRSGAWSREQRRFDVRMDVTIVPLETVLMSNDLAESDEESPDGGCAGLEGRLEDTPISATIRNISAGGIMMITTEARLRQGDHLKMRFSVEKNLPELKAIAEVRWVSWDDQSSGQKCKAGCEFLSLQGREKDAIAKSILTRQAALRRVGLM